MKNEINSINMIENKVVGIMFILVGVSVFKIMYSHYVGCLEFTTSIVPGYYTPSELFLNKIWLCVPVGMMCLGVGSLLFSDRYDYLNSIALILTIIGVVIIIITFIVLSIGIIIMPMWRV